MDINSFINQAVSAGKTRQEAVDYLTSKGYIQPEEKRGLSTITPSNILIGAGKGVLSTVKGISSLGEKTFGRLMGAYKGGETSAEQLIPSRLTEGKGLGENIGKTAEQMAEFFIPGSASLKAGEVAAKVVKGGKLLRGAAKLGATGLTEAVLGTGQSALQSGNLSKKELGVGAVSLVAPAVIAGVGKAATLLRPASEKVTEYVYKAIKPNLGTQATKQAIDTYSKKAVDAFGVIKQNKGILEYEDNVGNLVNRLPENRAELLDAIGKVKMNLYSSWRGLEDKASGAMYNPDGVIAKLDEVISSKKYSPEVRNYAESLKPQIEELRG